MKSIYKDIVVASLSEDKQKVDFLFQKAMAQVIKEEVDDLRHAIAQKMFEDTDQEFMPAKQDYTVEANDPDGNLEHFPAGMPVKYKVNAYSPMKAYQSAVEQGHQNIKVTDAAGEDVTHQCCGNKKMNEGIESGAIVSDLENERIAKEEQDLEDANQARIGKSPTMQDVVSVLGNTVSVTDTNAAR